MANSVAANITLRMCGIFNLVSDQAIQLVIFQLIKEKIVAEQATHPLVHILIVFIQYPFNPPHAKRLY